jgi:hypothetical protein
MPLRPRMHRYVPALEDDDNTGVCSFGGINGWQGKSEVVGGKPAPVPLRPPQRPTCTARERNVGLRGKKPASKHLSYCMVISFTLTEHRKLQTEGVSEGAIEDV